MGLAIGKYVLVSMPFTEMPWDGRKDLAERLNTGLVFVGRYRDRKAEIVFFI
jgi:hypothetical protein